MKRKLFSGLLTLAMVFSCIAFPYAAFEADAYETCGYYRYIILEDGTAEITRYLGKEENLVIPDTLDGLTVTSIEPWQGNSNSEHATGVPLGAFERCETLQSVVIPDTITHIGENSFSGCICLESITIPSNLTDIEGTAFDNTPWLDNKRAESPMVIINDVLVDGKTCTGNVAIPDSVKAISIHAFYNSKITDIIIPDSITAIKTQTFLLCNNLKSITIPKSIINIEHLGIPNYYNNLIIKCYSGTSGHQYAIDNDFEYELLDSELQGKVYYQVKGDDSAIRFIAEVSIEDVTNANSGNIKISSNNEEYNIKVKTAYNSITANGQVKKASEGKCFIISPTIEISNDDRISITAEFNLDGCNGNITRGITL